VEAVTDLPVSDDRPRSSRRPPAGTHSLQNPFSGIHGAAACQSIGGASSA